MGSSESFGGTMASGFFWDGYLHWARDIEAKDPEFGNTADDLRRLYEPVFVRLKLGFDAALFAELQAFFTGQYPDLAPDQRGDALAELDEGVSFLRDYVFDLLEPVIGFQHAIVERTSPEFFIYRPVATTPAEHDKDAAFFEILNVGAPVRLEPGVVLGAGIPRPDPGMDFAGADVFAAVIDNDIGFLNHAFRDPENPDQTRFAAIWLQAHRLLGGQTGGHDIQIGRVLDRAMINGMVNRYGRDERRAYGDMNTSLHARAGFRLPPKTETHGSMVAGLAFANEHLGSRQVPLLAVQLPPEAARDTSGATGESYIVQGFRWICYCARAMDTAVPVVVNISYGVLAGQKDGGKFIEEQIRREIEIAGKYCVGKGRCQKVEVVFAFGNSRNGRQVADVSVRPGKHVELTWLLPGDNAAPAFVELRAVDNAALSDLPATMRVSLFAPDGTKPIELAGTGGTTTIDAAPPVTADGGAAPARLYNVPYRAFSDRPSQPGYTLAAVGPTRRRGHGLAVARAGAWVLKLTNDGAAPVRVVLQIQRGDTAPGFRRARLQTRFDGALAPNIEDGVAGQTVLPPLTNEGTNSAFANVDLFHTAGAGRDVFGATVPASYSGQGADWTTEIDPDPPLDAVDRAFSFGVRTNGTYTGTHANLSGTSAAAALKSRRLAKRL